MKESRVLVVSASMGGGHDGAARELLRRIHNRGHHAQMVDFLDAFPLRIGFLVRLGYWLELRYAPWSYDATYRLWYRIPFFVQPLGLLINLLTRRKMLRWVRQSDADVVVSTYPMASLVLGAARQQGRLSIPVATFITDFAVHPLWTHPGVDLHMCVHPQSAEAAAARSGRAATAPGPMVPDRFHSALPDRSVARKALGFDDDERLVLVVAGAWGIGDITTTFDTLVADGRYTPLAVCGNNEQLRKKLQARGVGHVLGWTDEMPTLMAASDVLVQNAGGLTCMEAFAAGLPVVSFEPIAGHGKDNAEQMADAGVATYAADADELFPVLDRATSLAGRSTTAKGRAMFADDPAEEVLDLAAAHAPATVPVRAGRRATARRVTAGVAAIAATYAAFTAGVGTAAAHGIGIAHPKKAGAVYLAVRLNEDELKSATLPDVLRQANGTAIVCGRLAAVAPDGLRRLQSSGVPLANGGWGHRDAVQWGRARSDLMRSLKAIHTVTGERPREFVPQRRIDGFDLASARLVHERVVMPSVVLTEVRSIPKLRAGQVVVVDGRGESVDELLHNLYNVQQNLATNGLSAAPLSDI
ncbi:MAG: glycosyltransferase [Acidimicrobiia bacterium]|nr:glycosyltransferase [Acidimicrobiia bacterium]